MKIKKYQTTDVWQPPWQNSMPIIMASLHSLWKGGSNDNKGNAFPTRHAPSTAYAATTTTHPAIATVATDNEDDDNDNVWIHPPPPPELT